MQAIIHIIKLDLNRSRMLHDMSNFGNLHDFIDKIKRVEIRRQKRSQL